jgi:superfamily II DNA/RNA helicase
MRPHSAVIMNPSSPQHPAVTPARPRAFDRVDPALQVPQALCMCPTRELVLQNLHVLRRMAKYTTIKVRGSSY